MCNASLIGLSNLCIGHLYLKSPTFMNHFSFLSWSSEKLCCTEDEIKSNLPQATNLWSIIYSWMAVQNAGIFIASFTWHLNLSYHLCYPFNKNMFVFPKVGCLKQIWLYIYSHSGTPGRLPVISNERGTCRALTTIESMSTTSRICLAIPQSTSPYSSSGIEGTLHTNPTNWSIN